MQRPHAQLVYSAEHAQTQLHRDGRLLTGVMHNTLLVCRHVFENKKGAGAHALRACVCCHTAADWQSKAIALQYWCDGGTAKCRTCSELCTKGLLLLSTASWNLS